MWAGSWLLAALTVVVAGDNVYQLSNATGGNDLLDWSDPAAWLGGLVPPDVAGDAHVDLTSEAGPARLLVGSKKAAVFDRLSIGPTSLVLSNDVSFGLQHLELGEGASMLVSDGTWAVSVTSASCNVTRFVELANAHTSSLLRCNTLNVFGALVGTDDVFLMTGFNLTSQSVNLFSHAHIQFGPGDLRADEIYCGGRACVIDLLGRVALSSNSIYGGYLANIYPSSTDSQVNFTRETTLSELMLAGSGDGKLLIIHISATLQIVGSVSFSYLDIHTAAHSDMLKTEGIAKQDIPPLVSVQGNLTFARQSFIDSGGLDRQALSFVPGSSLIFRAEGGLEVRGGVIALQSATLIMDSFAQLLVMPRAKLSLTDTDIIAGGGQGATLSVELGVSELVGYSRDVFSCGALLSLYGGSFVSSGKTPAGIQMSGGVHMVYNVNLPQLFAPHADVSVSELDFLGGRIYCSSLSVVIVRLYASGDNTVSCPVGISNSIRFTVSDADDYLLVFESDLKMADNTAFEWRNNPGDAAPLSVGGFLILGQNVSLHVRHVPRSQQLEIVPLISYSGMSGSFATIIGPADWSVNVTSTGVFLSRSFVPVSTATTTTAPIVPTVPPPPSRIPLIIGLAVGGTVFGVLVISLIVCLVRMRRNRERRRFLRDDEILSGEQQKLIVH